MLQKVRVNEVQSNPSDGTNCYGTAFFVVGLTEEDRFVGPQDAASALACLKQLDSPVLGSLISFEMVRGEGKNLEIVLKHLGVVLENNRVLHRRDASNNLAQAVDLQEFFTKGDWAMYAKTNGYACGYGYYGI